MCGRYSLVCIDDLGNRFRVFDPSINFRSRFNVAPSQEMPVIVQQQDTRGIITMPWGLALPGSRETAYGMNPINIRCESLAEKPVFHKLLQSQRCLVPASGFYEWKNEGSRKIPFYFHLPGRPLFAFAGIYSTRIDAAGRGQTGYAIITTRASGPAARVHDRMPVILAERDEEHWLAGCPPNPGDLPALPDPAVPDEMEIYPVSGRVNKPENDDSSLIRPLAGLGF